MNNTRLASFLNSRTDRQLAAYCRRVNVEYCDRSRVSIVHACLVRAVERCVAKMSDLRLNDRREYDTADLRTMYALTPNHARLMRRLIHDRVNT